MDFNNNRIETANSEGELWKVANDVIKPRSNESIYLIVVGVKLTDEKEVAEAFKSYFVDKIADLEEDLHALVHHANVSIS